ncbi:MAG TPA: malectin domain-containing carbohydrate-binding protein, partial [Verrucomicrobiae bacterium]|nr:malectin domain-containing carbohydrate-binding protein [Verrucomicrobiae bacterium]
TNAPAAPTVWNVKRSTNSSGPFFIVGEHVNSGVTASAFTDSAVTAGVTYYYVVTAVNSLGEGPASAVVSAQLVPATSVAVNCGGGAAGSFQADNFFDSGTAFATSSSIDTAGLAQPAPVAVYQSQRYGDLTYTLRGLFPNSSYELRLHFAEVYWTSPGQRVFNVLINGGTALANFDITADSGGSLRGDIKEFYAVSDPLGRIKLQLVTVLDNAAINGIEAHEMTPVSVPAAPANLTATTGNAVVNLSWLAPSGATGFYVKRASSSGGPYVTIATNVSASSYADVGFTPNTACYYVVTATNAFGESPPTPEVRVQAPSGLPDVVVTSVSWTPANLFSGTHAIFTARVLNRGSAPTPAGTVLGVGFNMDGAGTVSWSGSYSAALAPGASVDLSADNGPSGVNYWVATRGPHTLVATVDDINRFPESDESNNSLSVGVPVLASPFSISKLSVTNGWAVVEWESSPGSTYQVQTTDTLLHPSWKAVGTNVTATATLSRATNGVDSATARFYRIARFD